MLRLVRLTVLAGILATSPQITSAQNVEIVDKKDARFTCPSSYRFIPVRIQRESLYSTDGDWGAGAVEIPFEDIEYKRSGGIWDITCQYGIRDANYLNKPTRAFATVVRRVRASRCLQTGYNRLESRCDPPIDPGLDEYQPSGGTPEPPVDPGLDVYQPSSETPPSPPAADPGLDVSQAGGGTDKPPPTVDRGVDVYQPGSVAPRGSRVRPRPPPPPPEN